MGLGLSTACGFRVFVPLMILSLSAVGLGLPLPAELSWLDSPVACVVLSSATLLEIGAYYVPWLDNALDMLASPLAVMAGALISFGFLPEMSPLWQWSIALIAGGGLAGITQGATVATRATSSATTGGLGNFVVSSLEAVFAVVLSILAILAPFIALLALAGIGLWGLQWLRKRRKLRENSV